MVTLLLKRLAAQTAVYGLSSIIGRFLNYLLVPLFTYYFAPEEYGVIAEFYAYIGFFSVVLLFGMETGYFRYREKGTHAPELVYATTLRFIVLANIGIFGVFVVLAQPLAEALQYAAHPEYIVWSAAILGLDSIGAIAFARLRAEQRAWRFAGVKLTEIFINVGLSLFFIVGCRKAYEVDPHSWLGQCWDPAIGIGYIFLANLVASLCKFLLLTPQLRGIGAGYSAALLGQMTRYSAPLIVIGLAGIVNEMLDRVLMKFLLPYDPQTNLAQLGIYSACYKLSILMALFIQAFRYAAEPFFFAHARAQDATRAYALVLNYFVICCVGIFLLVTLYIDLFKYFIGAPYRAGLDIVPILLLAHIFLGIYVNLSIWYKLTDRTWLGAGVAVVGAGVTIGLLVWWVPLMGYRGAAWATLACYVVMVLVSAILGRKYYPVPYEWSRVLFYLLFGAGLWALNTQMATVMSSYLSATMCLLIYLIGAFLLDGRVFLRRATRN